MYTTHLSLFKLTVIAAAFCLHRLSLVLLVDHHELVYRCWLVIGQINNNHYYGEGSYQLMLLFSQRRRWLLAIKFYVIHTFVDQLKVETKVCVLCFIVYVVLCFSNGVILKISHFEFFLILLCPNPCLNTSVSSITYTRCM